MNQIAEKLLDPAALDDLLREVGEKNHVRVVKFAAVKPQFQRTHYRKVMDELGESTAPGLPALVLQDCLRQLAGKKPIYLPEALSRIGGELRSVAPNLRTTVGADFVANVLGLAAQPDEADWIALSQNTATPAAGDTSASTQWATAMATDDTTPDGDEGEFTALGMARKQATYAHTNGTAVYTMAATWTASAAVTLVRLAGMFGGAGKTAQGSGATNILFLENTFTATTLANADQLSLTWTVNV